jgi:hypothetical protein
MSALPSSGQILYTAINTTLGRATRNQLALSDSQVRSLTGIATGQIKFTNFYGKSLNTNAAIANYDFRNTSSYTGSGTDVIDLSGNYNLTFNSAPTYNTNPLSITLTTTVSANSAFVNINLANGYTVELLFKYTSNTGNFFKIFSYASGNDNNGIQVQVNSSNQVYLWNTNTGIALTASAALSTNTWYHVIITSNSTIYVNGTSVTKTGSSTTLTNSNRVLAVGDQARTRSIVGNVAFARFYNKVLTATDVSSLYTDAKASGSYGLP